MVLKHRLPRRAPRTPLPLLIGVVALPGMLHAQVGLMSGLAQVTLVARVAPQASIEGLGPALEVGSQGTLREVSVAVGVAANTGFRLVVLRTDAEAMASGRPSPLWVRAVNGDYQLLGHDLPIVVVREGPTPGQTEREVHYRVETRDWLHSLPVRYEIVIDPEL